MNAVIDLSFVIIGKIQCVFDGFCSTAIHLVGTGDDLFIFGSSSIITTGEKEYT